MQAVHDTIPGSLLLNVPGEHLIKRLHERVEANKMQAAAVNKKIDAARKRLQALRGNMQAEIDEMDEELGQQPMGAHGFSPGIGVVHLRQEVDLFEKAATYLAFLADHVDPKETYHAYPVDAPGPNPSRAGS